VRWSWTNGRQPNTSTAGIFTYSVTAHYYDNSSNSATVTLKVKPKTPEIDPSSVSEKAGKTGQNVVVNVKDGVPDNSTVTLYSGDEVIGRGTTTRGTATINVSRALPSTAIRAKTSVQSGNSSVESEFSAPVIPTEVPDRVAPTVSINGNRLSTNADESIDENSSPDKSFNRYDGATLLAAGAYAWWIAIVLLPMINAAKWINKKRREKSRGNVNKKYN